MNMKPRYTAQEKAILNQSRIFSVTRTFRHWFMADGSQANEWQTDAIALGFIKGYSNVTQETLATIGPCGYNQAFRHFQDWVIAHPKEYREGEQCFLAPTPETILTLKPIAA